VAARAASVPAAARLSGLALAATAATAYQYRRDAAVRCDAPLPVEGAAGTNRERTFLAVKPDGVQRGLVGDITGATAARPECRRRVRSRLTLPLRRAAARFEKRGYKVRRPRDRSAAVACDRGSRSPFVALQLVGLKMVWPTREMAENHYKDLAKKPFYPG
jgi:nucleoside-diphosphate kinase